VCGKGGARREGTKSGLPWGRRHERINLEKELKKRTTVEVRTT